MYPLIFSIQFTGIPVNYRFRSTHEGPVGFALSFDFSLRLRSLLETARPVATTRRVCEEVKINKVPVHVCCSTSWVYLFSDASVKQGL